MIVLLDLEWIEKNEKFLTQLSVVRTDESWNVVSSMEIFVKPGAECFKEPDHMAFGGISTDLYRAAFSEKDCIAFTRARHVRSTQISVCRESKHYGCNCLARLLNAAPSCLLCTPSSPKAALRGS